LIKDNHIGDLRATGMSLGDIVAKARRNAPAGITVEVEVTNVAEAREALQAGADIIMLDNMGLDDMAHVVKLAAGRVKIEASGGRWLTSGRGADWRRYYFVGADYLIVWTSARDGVPALKL
jgi:nicotinate-nucleotide pyrophosphorylase (carboxylating)